LRRAWLGALLLLPLACGSPEPPARARVLLVGVDGASPRVTGPLLREGRLPTLAGLARRGASGSLRSSLPLFSPRVWTTLATGKAPEKHGIRSFARPAAGGELQLYRSSDRRTHALWNIASDAGLRVGVVNWWTTHPPERIDGVMVTDHLFPEEVANLGEFVHAEVERQGVPVHPEAWLERVLAQLGRPEPLTSVANPFDPAGDLPEWVASDYLARRFRFDSAATRIALEIEAEIRPDLLMVLLPGIDKVSHYLWGALEPEGTYPAGVFSSPERRQASLAALYDYYVYTDALIGLLASRYGPGDLVLVVSDHGFEAALDLFRLTGVHKTEAASDGVLFAAGPGIPAGAASDGMAVVDVTPSVLAWLGLPLGRDMDGRPAAFLERQPPPPIETWDRTPIERVGAPSQDAEERLLEELRSLGYLD
jgi:predicted AlkP superfamily phosphohydrolase/phosphomutase